MLSRYCSREWHFYAWHIGLCLVHAGADHVVEAFGWPRLVDGFVVALTVFAALVVGVALGRAGWPFWGSGHD